MVDMDYLNIDMNICQLLLLRYNDQNLQASDNDNDNDNTFIEHKYRLQMKIYIYIYNTIYYL